MLYVLLVRIGWVDDITTAKKAIKEGKIKVNGVTTRSPLKNLCPGAVVEARESLSTQGLPDTSFLPHLISLSSRKFMLTKNPEFHPEKSFLDLKRGLNQI
jgi:ribosome-associated protein YbcJ (S4-like RNA binding protein)